MLDSKLQNKVLSLFVHWLPAIIVDIILVLSGKKAKLFKIQQKFRKGMDAVQLFVERDFKFNNDNLWRVWNTMSKADQEV